MQIERKHLSCPSVNTAYSTLCVPRVLRGLIKKQKRPAEHLSTGRFPYPPIQSAQIRKKIRAIRVPYIVLADLKILFQRIPSRQFPFFVENQINSGLPTIWSSGT